MGRKGSTLVPFLLEGLKYEKYGCYLTCKKNIIQIILPRNTKNLSCDSMKILKDWNIKKGRKFKDRSDYTKAKQGMLAALRRSDYLERVPFTPNLCYRILSSKEVKEKKRKLKEKRKSPSLDKVESPLSVDSGFESGVESPLSINLTDEIEMECTTENDILNLEYEVHSPNFNEFQFFSETLSPVGECASAVNDESVVTSNNILNALRHDHDFGFSLNTRVDENAPSNFIDSTVLTVEENFDVTEKGDFPKLTDSQYEELLRDISSEDILPFDDFMMNENEEEQVIMRARVLKIKSEQLLGETILLTCEPKDEELHIFKCDFNTIPSDGETSQRLQSFQVIEVKEIEENVLLRFSDENLIALDGNISKKLKLFQIAEVKRLDNNYVLFFLSPQKC